MQRPRVRGTGIAAGWGRAGSAFLVRPRLPLLLLLIASGRGETRPWSAQLGCQSVWGVGREPASHPAGSRAPGPLADRTSGGIPHARMARIHLGRGVGPPRAHESELLLEYGHMTLGTSPPLVSHEGNIYLHVLSLMAMTPPISLNGFMWQVGELYELYGWLARAVAVRMRAPWP